MSRVKSGGSFGVTIDVSPLNKLTEGLKGFEKEIPGAASSAINRTLTQVVTKLGRIVTDQYAVKSKEVKETTKGNIRKSSKGNLKASIRSAGHTLSFAHFPFTPKKPSKRQVKVKIINSKGKVASKHGFVASTGAKVESKTQYNVFRRTGKFSIAEKGRYQGKMRENVAPIRTLSIPQMITNQTTSEQITEFANSKLAERVDHEIKYRLENVQKKLKG